MITVDDAAIRQLLSDVGDDVLSLYLEVDPSDPNNQRSSGREAWRIWLKNALRDLEEDVGDERDAKDRWRRTTAEVERFVSTYQPGGRTLALFADPEGKSELELPIRLENDAAYGQPRAGPLLWAIDEYQHYLAVLVGADKIRVVSAYLGYLNNVAQLDFDKNWGMTGATRSGHQFRFEAHREKHQRSYQQAIADDISKLVFENPDVDRVILGGNEKEAHGVRNLMHPKAAAAVVAVLPIPIGSSDAEVVERVEPVAVQFERDEEVDSVDRIVTLTESGGRGALGAADVQKCLDRQMVRTLVLASPPEDRKKSEETVRQAFLESARVEFVHGPAADKLTARGGIGAELYYAP